MKNLFGFIVCAIAISTGSAKDDKVNPNIVNVNVDRNVDISSHVVKIVTDVTILNNGKSATSSYLYAVPLSSHEYLAYIGASKKDGSHGTLEVSPAVVKVAGHEGVTFYNVKLPSVLHPDKTVKLSIETVFPHFLRPFPVEIAQSEKQFVVYEDPLYYYSPYTTTRQTIVVTTTTSAIESYTKVKPTTLRDNVITYGPYMEVAPFTESTVRVHYENNSPFLTVSELVRIIEVSHWGNVAVEEHIDIHHSGAKLRGPFSRYHYQRLNDGVSSVRSFKVRRCHRVLFGLVSRY